MQQLALCRDLAAVIAVLRDAARALTSADGVTVVLKEGELCHYVEENAIAPLWKGQRFPLASCISGWSMLHHQQVVIPDIYADARIPHDAYRPTFVKSLAMTPLGTRETLGALGAYWAREHVASEDELRILQALAAAAASAVENLQLLEKLRGEARRKDEFLSLLAHELRNPLAPIANALQILRRSSGDALVGEMRGIMERQLGHLVHLIDDLLDLSRVSRGVLNLRRSRLDLVEVVRSAIETARPALEAANHRLSVALPNNPLWVDGDATRLAQVLGNLLHNAAKFTAPGGSVALTLEERGADALLSVKDTGRGIPGEKLGEIFEMFAQVDTSSRALGGLGIGLSLSRRLVELHGGRIEARSAGAGHGSEFIVTLPRLQAPRAPGRIEESRTPQTGNGRRMRVLVVDDNVDAAQTLAMLVGAMGHAVEVAHDGPAGLEASRRQRPDLAFLDIALPGMDGYELARRLRREASADLRIIALTGFGQDEDRRRSQEAGFDQHVVKPLDPHFLQSLLGAA